MGKKIVSTDGVTLHYTETGHGKTSLVFVHGWLGNTEWWKSQEDFFSDQYNIVRIDLGGHGKSGKTRQIWTAGQYADDIVTVVNHLELQSVILVGHSMSGAYVLLASYDLPNVKAVILVDTLKDLDQVITPEQAEEFMFSHYRNDFRSAVENILPRFLFAEGTPEGIKRQLQNEFLQVDPGFAITMLKPLYEMDIREIAMRVDMPVRAINSDSTPTNMESNCNYFRDYNYRTITGTGHYPMMEKPEEFNRILKEVLVALLLPALTKHKIP
jgi:pimeloyl-ACP methyl ester carboxylesterase